MPTLLQDFRQFSFLPAKLWLFIRPRRKPPKPYAVQKKSKTSPKPVIIAAKARQQRDYGNKQKSLESHKKRTAVEMKMDCGASIGALWTK